MSNNPLNANFAHILQESAFQYFQDQLVALFTDLVAQDNPSWKGLGSSPLSAFSGERHSDPVGWQRARISDAAALLSGGGGEFRLNTAGLKLYGSGVQYNARTNQFTFSIRINRLTDQGPSYPAFCEHFEREIESRGLKDFSFPPKE